MKPNFLRKRRAEDSENASSDGKSEEKAPDDGGENRGEEQQQPPSPVGFWDHRLHAVRMEAMRKWLYTTVVLMIFILSVLSLYWAVFFHLPKNLQSLVVYVVDFDGLAPYDNAGNAPVVGPLITQLTQQMLQAEVHLGYGSLPPSQFQNDPIRVRQAVYDWDCWAAIIVNPNATAMLYSAIQNGNTSYDPMGAMQLIYQDARDDTNWYDFLSPQLNMFMTKATSMIGQQWAQMVLRNASDPAILRNIQAVPQALSPAVGFSQFNLRPFYPYVAIPAVSIGLIYLIIISFFSFSFYLPIHMKYLKPEGHPPLHFYQLVLWRWLATITAYLFLSLAYSFISMAFQINFTHMNPITSHTEVTDIAYGNPVAYGHGTFLVYWMLNFWGMIALGLACENVSMIVGQPWTALWLIFWVITNVSTAFYDIGIEPHFYYWGYAWPLHSVVEGSRQILFDLHSRIGLDFGILIAWGAVNSALFPFCCRFMKYKNSHGLHEYWA